MWIESAGLDCQKWQEILANNKIVTQSQLLATTQTQAKLISSLKTENADEQAAVDRLFKLQLGSGIEEVACICGVKLKIELLREHNCAQAANMRLEEMVEELERRMERMEQTRKAELKELETKIINVLELELDKNLKEVDRFGSDLATVFKELEGRVERKLEEPAVKAKEVEAKVERFGKEREADIRDLERRLGRKLEESFDRDVMELGARMDRNLEEMEAKFGKTVEKILRENRSVGELEKNTKDELENAKKLKGDLELRMGTLEKELIKVKRVADEHPCRLEAYSAKMLMRGKSSNLTTLNYAY